MKHRLYSTACALLAGSLLLFLGVGRPAAASAAEGGKKIKIGFLVPQPDEPWFQYEWKFAEQAAKKYNFDLIKIGAVDGEKTLAAIDNLAAQGVRGFVICIPEVRLGPAIVARAKANDMKLFTVDDQFVGGDGKFMDVYYMGIAARKIGKLVGESLMAELKQRKWNLAETGACGITYDQLDTCHERSEGATEALKAAGFPASNIYVVPQKTTDIPGAFDAANVLLTRHGTVKHWLIFSCNDEGVLGAVRALEGRGFAAADIIGIGINGQDLADFQKTKPTGFFASVLLSPRRHGYETAEWMYK